MENSLQIQQIELFLEEVIIRELGKMQEIEISYMPFVLMGQAIEVLGGFLDNKPMKAKGQSSRRFSNSVNRLFGGRYRLLNDKLYLYDKLRNQIYSRRGFVAFKPCRSCRSLSAFTVFRRKISFNSRRVLSGYLSGLPAFGESFEGRPDKTEKYSI